jgi:hypothetical protein
VQGKLAFLHHRTAFERTPTSAYAAFEKFGTAEPIMFGDVSTAFTSDPGFFTMGFQVNFAAFLIRKIVDKGDDIHGVGYF